MQDLILTPLHMAYHNDQSSDHYFSYRASLLTVEYISFPQISNPNNSIDDVQISNNLSSPIRTMFIRNNEINNYNTRNRTTLHVPIGTSETNYTTCRFHGIYI